MKNATTIDSNDTVTTPRAGERLDKKGTLRSLEAEMTVIETKIAENGTLGATVEIVGDDEFDGYTGQIRWEGVSKYTGVLKFGVAMTFDSRGDDVKGDNDFCFLNADLCKIVQASTQVIRWTAKVSRLHDKHLAIIDSADVS
tara:strand:+ start:506 stop:931 length:426 start_codon:yes stop_codon:yes gene_type:complete